MKTILLTLGIGITTACSSFAGPSWGFTLGNGASFSWNGGGGQRYNNNCYQRPRTMPIYRETVIVGPQYYRMHGNPGCGRIRNYMDAPIVVKRRGGSVIIPRSWD